MGIMIAPPVRADYSRTGLKADTDTVVVPGGVTTAIPFSIFSEEYNVGFSWNGTSYSFPTTPVDGRYLVIMRPNVYVNPNTAGIVVGIDMWGSENFYFEAGEVGGRATMYSRTLPSGVTLPATAVHFGASSIELYISFEFLFLSEA